MQKVIPAFQRANIKVSNLYVVDVSGICLHWAVKGTIRTRIEFYVEDQLD